MYLKDESATLLIATQLAEYVNKSISTALSKEEAKESAKNSPQHAESPQRLEGPVTTQSNFIIYLKGDLGSGKTCFARGFLRGLGYQGRVKSPTFTVVEPYLLNEISVYHLDLYRLSHPEELEYLGLRDFLANNVILLIEWPERGRGDLPKADIEIQLQHCQDPQQDGRQLDINATSTVGQEVVSQLLNNL